MNCALCREVEANKNNTHYLTDGIIRSCLNLNGSNERERGFYYKFPRDSAFLDFNFQRATSVEKVENEFGRQINDNEIEKAKEVPFSVDGVFCVDCEQHFTEIESKFISDVLPRFRKANLTNVDKLVLKEKSLIRLFFYLQVWRTAICEQTFSVSDYALDKLRKVILNYRNLADEEIDCFPLIITYLETIGGDYEYTTNFVGSSKRENPSIILMNDFSIQFFDKIDNVKYLSYHELNSEIYFNEFINYKEKSFTIKILHNEERKEFLKQAVIIPKARLAMQYYAEVFNNCWFSIFKVNPSSEVTHEFIKTIVGSNIPKGQKYNEAYFDEMIYNFVRSKI